MYVAALKLYLTLTLGIFGISPAWCESCGEMYPAHEMETHTFADEYDHGIETYDLEICPVCVDYWTK